VVRVRRPVRHGGVTGNGEALRGLRAVLQEMVAGYDAAARQDDGTDGDIVPRIVRSELLRVSTVDQSLQHIFRAGSDR